MSRLAVVLFNLGGPDGPKSVRPFLRNLFSDPAIIGAPAPVRFVLAETISRLREKMAIENYATMGGASPLGPGTRAQADSLCAILERRRPADETRIFIAMRYWRPFTEETAKEVAAFQPDDIVLLPLYPHYSTTTTCSSLAAWDRAYHGPGRKHVVCCYPDQGALTKAHARLIGEAWRAAGAPKPVRLLFSAHGLPERISAGGDPYRGQVERTCAAVAAELGPEWDWRVCYQSRVGPLKWIGPSTIEEIDAAARDGVAVVIDPIAFVSEHVETLVELDRDYADHARKVGVETYIRVPALGVSADFIEGLADLVEGALSAQGVRPGAGSCGSNAARCPLVLAMAAA